MDCTSTNKKEVSPPAHFSLALKSAHLFQHLKGVGGLPSPVWVQRKSEFKAPPASEKLVWRMVGF